MKAVFILCASALLMQAALADDPDPVKGSELFSVSACNSPDGLARNNPNITNRAELDRAVRQCDIKHEINWYEYEIQDIVAYLNQKYYQFN